MDGLFIPPHPSGGDFPRLVIIPPPIPLSPLPHPLKIIPRAMERGNAGDSVARIVPSETRGAASPSRVKRGWFPVRRNFPRVSFSIALAIGLSRIRQNYFLTRSRDARAAWKGVKLSRGMRRAAALMLLVTHRGNL